MIKVFIKYIPATFFFIVWLSSLSQGVNINKALNYPLNNKYFFQTLGAAIDNPWSHNTALRALFSKLMQEHASPKTWENAQLFANAIWQQYQYDGAIEFNMAVAHASNNIFEELYWGTIYDRLHGNNKLLFLKHAKIGHAKGEPLELSGQW